MFSTQIGHGNSNCVTRVSHASEIFQIQIPNSFDSPLLQLLKADQEGLVWKHVHLIVLQL